MARLTQTSSSFGKGTGSAPETRTMNFEWNSGETGADRVHVSLAAQVKHLKSKGNSLHVIAAKLNLPIEMVRDYLSTAAVSDRP
jgi:hypothetical protein